MAVNEVYTLNINLTMLTQYPDDMIEQLEEVCHEYTKNNEFYFDYNKINFRGERVNESVKGNLDNVETI